MAIIKIIDAVAWIIKYLVAASVDRGLLLDVNRGIIANMLISKPIHINIQWLLNIVVNVPRITVKYSRVSAVILISTGRINNQHFRGMGPIALLADLTRVWCNR